VRTLDSTTRPERRLATTSTAAVAWMDPRLRCAKSRLQNRVSDRDGVRALVLLLTGETSPSRRCGGSGASW